MPTTKLIEKIEHLPPHKIAEVEDFVDFLSSKIQPNGDVAETGAVTVATLRDMGIEANSAAEQRAALASFTEDWERPDMDIYDSL
jgi:hypothetical protein